MLDFMITFVIIFLTSLKRLLSYFVFRPPKLSTYTTEKIEIDSTVEEVYYYLKIEKVLLLKRGRKEYYEPVHFSTVKHEYIRIPDGNSFIPIIVFKPINCFDVCIIYSHGNSCDIGLSFLECLDISLNTYSCVILYEYPGYGLCKNRKLTEEGIYYNIRKVHKYATSKLKFKPEEIILYGHSLGTGPSIDLAIDKKYPVSAIVLQAPFLSILRTVANFNNTAFYDFFPNLDKVSKLEVPVLIFHGTRDSIVPIEDGSSLAKMIQPHVLYEFVKIVDGDHNDLIKNHKMILYGKLREFISYSTNKRYSFNLKHSKDDDINSEFFRKLNPHRGDDEPSMERNGEGIENENNSINFVIRNYIEIEVSRNPEENQMLNTLNKNKINEENFIKIEMENANTLNENEINKVEHQKEKMKINDNNQDNLNAKNE